MMYEKPELQLIAYSPDKTMANGGLGTWLEDNSFSDETADHISTYELNS